MAPKRPVAVLGGTFDRLHIGHRVLLDEAFRAGRTVGIGLTTAKFLRGHPKPGARSIQPFPVRRAALERYLSRRYSRGRWWILPLEDGWGRSVEPGVDVLVASAETVSGARSVNAERTRRHLPRLVVRLVPVVRGEDGLPVSSRRIRAGVIDARGRRLRPLQVQVVARSEADRKAVRRAFRLVFPGQSFRWMDGPSGGIRQRRATDYRVRVAAGTRSVGREVRLEDATGRSNLRRSGRTGAVERVVGKLLRERVRAGRVEVIRLR